MPASNQGLIVGTPEWERAKAMAPDEGKRQMEQMERDVNRLAEVFTKPSRAERVLNDLQEAAYFAGLSNAQLFDALCERIEPVLDCEESEMSNILTEIASRMGEPTEGRK